MGLASGQSAGAVLSHAATIKYAFETAAIGANVNATPMKFALAIFAFILGAIGPSHAAKAVLNACSVFAFIDSTRRVGETPLAVALAAHPLALVMISAGPGINAFPFSLALVTLAFVAATIRRFHRAGFVRYALCDAGRHFRQGLLCATELNIEDDGHHVDAHHHQQPGKHHDGNAVDDFGGKG